MNLIQIYDQSKNDEEFLLTKAVIENERCDFIGFLEFTNLNYACYNIYYVKECLTARNNFYQSALIRLFLNNFCNRSIFMLYRSFCSAIISDSQKLINQYLTYTDDFLDTFGSSFAKAIQAIIKGDDVSLQIQIENLEKHTDKKSIAKNYSGIPVAFKGILQNDKMLVEQGIYEILAKHNKQEHPAVIKDFLNIEALTMAKLSIRKGIIVEIDNPLLPKAMIPIKELERYESYDFLKEIEPA